MDTRYVVGLDSSPTGTALSRVYADGSYDTTKIFPGNLRDFARMELIEQAVVNFAGNAAMVAIEGPALGYDGEGQQGRHENAGLWWQLATALAWKRSLPLAYVAPTTLKVYATGNGACKKLAVMMALTARYGFAMPDEDQGDAFVLALMAADHLGFAPRELPKTHRRALDSVVWPRPGDRPGISLFASTKPPKASAPRQRKPRKATTSSDLVLAPDEEELMLPLLVGEGG